MSEIKLPPEPNGVWLLAQRLGVPLLHEGTRKNFDGIDVELVMARSRNWVKLNIFASQTREDSPFEEIFESRPNAHVAAYSLWDTPHMSWMSKTFYVPSKLLRDGDRVDSLPRGIDASPGHSDVEFLMRVMDKFSIDITHFFDTDLQPRVFDLVDRLKEAPRQPLSRLQINL